MLSDVMQGGLSRQRIIDAANDFLASTEVRAASLLGLPLQQQTYCYLVATAACSVIYIYTIGTEVA